MPRLRALAVLGALAGLVAPAGASGASTADRSAAAFTAVAGKPAARHDGNPRAIRPKAFSAFRVDEPRLAGVLDDASAVTVSIPGPDGAPRRFRVREASVLAPADAAAHPELRSYRGTGVDDPRATVALSLTPLGLSAAVRAPGGGWYVDPLYRNDPSVHVAYRRADLDQEAEAEPAPIAAPPALDPPQARQDGLPVTLRTYDVALVNDPSYAAYFKNDPSLVLASKVALLSRVNQIYNDDLAIQLRLVELPGRLNLATADAWTAAGFSATSCGSALLDQAPVAVAQRLGDTAFDVGHVMFGKKGGGLAGAGVVGGPDRAQGCTALLEPVGDPFAVDYVAHELGHQFGASHTFNGTRGSCSGNRAPGSAVEPGSGSSVMAYAGICDADDLQPHSDPSFSWRSIMQVSAFVAATPVTDREVQSVRLTGDLPFRFQGPDGDSATVPRPYTAQQVTDALTEIGVTAAVTGYAGAKTLGNTGFTVTWTGAGDQPRLAVAGTGASVGETVKGGARTSGGVATATGNRSPTVTAPPALAIPAQTPFTLTGAGSDPDGDPLTFSWEQANAGGPSGTALLDGDKRSGPLLRALPATVEPSRTFPDLGQVLAGTTNVATGACPPTAVAGTDEDPVPAPVVDCAAESLPTAGYTGGPLRFRLTARDARPGGGGTAFADTTVTVDGTAGPFLVTSQATPSTTGVGDPLPVTWAVAGTTNPVVDAQQVRLTLSLDGGLTYPVELAAATPNDGAETVVIPADAPFVADARLRVEALGGRFFDVSDAPLALGPPAPPVVAPPPAPPALAAATPAVAPLRAALTGLRKRVRVRRGRIAIPVRCLRAGKPATPCRGTVVVQMTVRGKRRAVGRATFTKRRTVTPRLSRAARRRAARRGGVRLRVVLTVRDGATPRRATRTVRAVTRG